MSNLSKTFSGQAALAGLNLTIEAGQVHALLGGNGSGKSTFIKILSGYHKPDPGGSVRVAGSELTFGSPESSRSSGCRFVHQDLGLIDTSSVLDNVMFGRGFPRTLATVRSRRARHLAVAMLDRAGLDLDPDALVGALTPAQKTEVAVARALSPASGEEVRLLVLDEPTATLPHDEVDQLLATIRRVSSHQVGVIFVTHRLEEVLRVAHQVTVLRDGRRIASRGMEGLTRSELVHLLVGDELDETQAIAEKLADPADAPVALTARSVSTQTVAPFDLDVRQGEIVGVAGITGSGREAVLGSLFGALKRIDGEVRVKNAPLRPNDPRRSIRAGMVFMPAERRTRGGVLGLSAQENLSLAKVTKHWRFPLMRRTQERRQTAYWFSRLGVRPDDGSTLPLSAFSGGNQQKILLARWLNCEPSVLMVDEPTQGVDIQARARIHEELVGAAKSGTAVLVSSSDVDELVALSHRVLILRAGEVVEILEGSDVTIGNVTRRTLVSTHEEHHEDS
ncbi:sugar ABC transporter ATP-binding protein [Acrocarpospora macrocephala]|uniref:Sugar ABC transporter ATP-binding protein n=1 Tax=Acrocarpospora macrocephala TaxID=150177 RepID=A0A5M3WH76_9ACTN|nr:sugar ABC transporter ATP-binding protein [Acrocarpospora macrocephala]GES08487.1 sugar ABC transporter ATP-binding protein [Acrocarpospora macrocephala]